MVPNTKRPWNSQEDGLLQRLVTKHGARSWRHIAERLGTNRPTESVRLRYLQITTPMSRTGPFSAWESAAVLRAREVYGNKWKAIAGFVPGRSATAIKDHWYNTLKHRTHYLSNHYIRSGHTLFELLKQPHSSSTSASGGTSSYVSDCSNVSPAALGEALSKHPHQHMPGGLGMAVLSLQPTSSLAVQHSVPAAAPAGLRTSPFAEHDQLASQYTHDSTCHSRAVLACVHARSGYTFMQPCAAMPASGESGQFLLSPAASAIDDFLGISEAAGCLHIEPSSSSASGPCDSSCFNWTAPALSPMVSGSYDSWPSSCSASQQTTEHPHQQPHPLLQQPCQPQPLPPQLQPPQLQALSPQQQPLLPQLQSPPPQLQPLSPQLQPLPPQLQPLHDDSDFMAFLQESFDMSRN